MRPDWHALLSPVSSLLYTCIQRKQKLIQMEKLHYCSLHELGEGLFLVDLVTNVVNEGGELVLGVIVNNVTDVREDYILEYAFLQVFQEPVE